MKIQMNTYISAWMIILLFFPCIEILSMENRNLNEDDLIFIDRAENIDTSYAYSENWKVVGWGEPNPSFNDDGYRYKRMSSELQYIIWNVPDLKDFEATMYDHQDELEADLRFFVGPDTSNFTEITVDFGERIPTASDWNVFTISSLYIPQNINFLKMEIEGGDNYTPQLGEIVMEKYDTSGVVNPKTMYVSKSGNDNTGDGTIDNPFLSIQQAVDKAYDGDKIIIKEGTYREKVDIDHANLTMENFGDDLVTISGADWVINWEPYKNGIYKAHFPEHLIDENINYTQLFWNGKYMEPARYPDEDQDKISSLEWTPTETLESGNNKGSVLLSESFPENYWKGGYYIGGNGANKNEMFSAPKGKIIASTDNIIECTDICWNWDNNWPSTVGTGRGFIIHHLNALNSEGEWTYQNDTVYFYPPSGEKPSDNEAEIRTRLWALDLSGGYNVTLKGLDVKAGSIDMAFTENCLIDSCTVRYPTPLSTYHIHPYGIKSNGSLGIYVSGKNNSVTNTYIGYGWGGLITLEGENNLLENCIVEYGMWLRERGGVVNCYGRGNILRNNTIRFSGVLGISGGNTKWIDNYGVEYLFEFNHIYETNHMSSGGAFYTNHKGRFNPHANAVIRYNWISVGHKGSPFGVHRYGIYLDDGSSGFLIHNNVIYNSICGFKTNRDNQDVKFFNNSVIYCDKSHDRWVIDEPTEILVYNNTGTSAYVGTDNQHNAYIDTSHYMNWENKNFQLKPFSEAVDFGMEIPGITDGYTGAAPDAGAYEQGKPWPDTPGADWETPAFPDDPYFRFKTKAPTRLEGSIDRKYAKITWVDNANNEDGFIILRSTGDDQFDQFAPFEIIKTIHQSNVEAFTDMNVEPGKEYRYIVQAFIGEEYSIQSNHIEILIPDDYLVDPAENFDIAYEYSYDWNIVGWGNPNPAFNDDGYRFRRETTETNYITWNTIGIENFEAWIYYNNTLSEEIKFFVSENNETFMQLENVSFSEPEATANGWYFIKASASGIQENIYNFLRIEVGGQPNHTPQIGKIEINMMSETSVPETDKTKQQYINDQILVIPNPSSEESPLKMKIMETGIQSQSARIKIFRTTGDLVYNSIQQVESNAVMEIDQKLPAGIYYVNIEIDGKSYINKIVRK